MSGIWGHMIGVVIVILMLVFAGIWLWAWRPRHKAAFDALARIPMDETEEPPRRENPAAVPADTRDRRPGAGTNAS